MKVGVALCAVTAGIALLLAWTIHAPVDENFSNPWPVRKMHAMVVLSHKFGEWMEYFGVMKIEDVYKFMVKLTLRSVQEESAHDLEILDKDIDRVPVRIRNPKTDSSRLLPGIIYIHGGAYIVGDRYQHDSILNDMARDLDSVVISVSYRLSFEAVWPGPLEDCLTVTRYFLRNGKKYGIDPDNIIIGGDSAGGQLTAAVTQALRDENFPMKPKAQFLIYMCGQVIDNSLPSRQQNANGPIVTKSLYSYAVSCMLVGNDSLEEVINTNAYLTPEIQDILKSKLVTHDQLPDSFHYPPYRGLITGNDYGTLDRIRDLILQPYLNPLLADSFSDLPPAFVFTTRYDVMRDDGILYAQALEKAKVPVKHFHDNISPHSVFGLKYSTEEGKELYDALIDFIKNL